MRGAETGGRWRSDRQEHYPAQDNALSLSDRMSRRSDESSTVARAAVVRASVSYRPLALSQGCSASLGARRLAYSSSSLAKATPHADARVERRRRVGTRYTSRDDPGARRRHRRGYRPFVEFDRRGGVWGGRLSNKLPELPAIASSRSVRRLRNESGAHIVTLYYLPLFPSTCIGTSAAVLSEPQHFPVKLLHVFPIAIRIRQSRCWLARRRRSL